MWMLIGVPVSCVGMQSALCSHWWQKCPCFITVLKGSLLLTWMTLDAGRNATVIILFTNYERAKVYLRY